MSAIKISTNVYWVGAIDWDLRFCGSYNTPRGTTYNAYLIVDGRAYRKFLKPGDKPEAEFDINGEKIEAREYCNLHGLWKA